MRRGLWPIKLEVEEMEIREDKEDGAFPRMPVQRMCREEAVT